MRWKFLKTILSILFICLAGLIPVFNVSSVQELGVNKVFYVYIPKTLSEASKLDIIGIHDTTKVSVYDITGEPAKLVKEGNLNRMGLLTVETDKEVYYKIVSDKPVAACVGAGTMVEERGPCGAMVYPAIDGSFVGKNFIFMARSGGNVTYPYVSFTVYAVEDSFVTVKASNGTELTSFTITANSYYDISGLIRRRQIIQVESTGNIIIVSWYGARFTSLPSITGDFIGKKFFGYINYYKITWVTPQTWQNDGGQGMFIVYAYEPSTVKVYDLLSRQLLYNKTFTKAGEYWYVHGPKPPAPTIPGNPPSEPYDPNLAPKHLLFLSDGDISVWSGDGGDSPSKIAQPAHFSGTGDITFVSGKNGKDFWFYAPQKAIVFAPTDISININGSTRTLKKDRYLTLTSGYYHIISDNPIIVQVQAGSGTNEYGTYLISYADIPATAPETGIGFPLWMIGIVIAVIIAAVLLISKQRRKGYKA